MDDPQNLLRLFEYGGLTLVVTFLLWRFGNKALDIWQLKVDKDLQHRQSELAAQASHQDQDWTDRRQRQAKQDEQYEVMIRLMEQNNQIILGNTMAFQENSEVVYQAMASIDQLIAVVERLGDPGKEDADYGQRL